MSFLSTLAEICKVNDYVQPEGMSSRLSTTLPPERLANLHFRRLSFDEVTRISSIITNKGDDKNTFGKYAVQLLGATVYIKTDDGVFRGFEKEEIPKLGQLLDETLVKALVEEAERANYMWGFAKERTTAMVGNS
ncbi:hypothetical protein UFOVP448_18 [uncultured Caudovirales phage]|uniref:Uncharacterized protein n=1 Tax=uncultured Caudovirales phage TaxID=2100421 RepID=A0A6J5M8P7_9CAUD|nr:hypothetical protein UFOVP448_18 [uncultured Caudovirales phage]